MLRFELNHVSKRGPTHFSLNMYFLNDSQIAKAWNVQDKPQCSILEDKNLHDPGKQMAYFIWNVTNIIKIDDIKSTAM